jgi:hypothetical protein
MAAMPGSSLPSFDSPPDLIFLSYARADRQRVEPIATALRARGASVWYDTNLAAGGSAYIESVRRALRRTSVMLVFLSAASINSAWVTDEVRAYRSLMAREPGHRLLVVHLDRTRPPLALAGVRAVDARDASPEMTVNLIASALDDAALAPTQMGKTAPQTSPDPRDTHSPTPQIPLTAQSQTNVATPGSSGQVFVSYDRTDHDRIQPFVAALSERGVRVWDGGGAAHGSAEYMEMANAELARSQTLLVAVSAASVASPWVADEIRAFQSIKARDAERALIALHLDRTHAPLSLHGAPAIDTQSLASDIAAQLIIERLPTGDFSPSGIAGAPATSEESALMLASLTEANGASTSTAPDASPLAETAPVLPAVAVAVADPTTEAALEAPAVETPTPVKANTTPAHAPMEETAPTMEATAPAMQAVAPVESLVFPETSLAAEPTTPIPSGKDQIQPTVKPQPETAEWNSAIGPAVLIIALLIALAVALWIHAGYPLPAGLGQ